MSEAAFWEHPMRARGQNWITPLRIDLLTDAEDDWVPIDDLLAIAFEYAEQADANPEEISIEFLRSLLSLHLVEVGDLRENGFEAWNTSTDETLARFIEGCSLYNWSPQGALWWINITPAGRKWLESARENS